jgi:hypothetical protein
MSENIVLFSAISRLNVFLLGTGIQAVRVFLVMEGVMTEKAGLAMFQRFVTNSRGILCCMVPFY